MRKKLSIIIPVYNAEAYLSSCIESILSQSFSDFEVLLIDDGSKDGSGAICDQYAEGDSRIHVFHKDNGGVSSARNLGLRHANGEWVCFVDADDELYADGLAVLFSGVSNQVDMVWGGYEVMDENKSVTYAIEERSRVDLSAETGLKWLFRPQYYRYMGFVWGKLFRRSVLSGVFFDPDIVYNEDRLFLARYISVSKKRICFMTNPVYGYVERKDSAMGRLSDYFQPAFTTDLTAMIRIRKIIHDKFPESKDLLHIVEQECYSSWRRIVGMMDEHVSWGNRLRLRMDLVRGIGMGTFLQGEWFRNGRRIKNFMRRLLSGGGRIHPALALCPLWALVLSSCAQKLVVPQTLRITDTVYVTDTKIYRDTIQVSDTLIKYVKKYDNPVIRKDTPDPSVIRKDRIFYLYSTESGKFPHIPIYKSIDLVNWYFVGTAFTDRTRPTSFEGNLWAPDINEINGKYVLYYSMSKWGGEWECGIGVAVADHPKGPFRDVGKLFDSKEINVQNSIDPFFITDGGNNYLFWGSHHGIYGIQLSRDGLSVKDGVEPRKIAGPGGEGTYIHKHGAYYYLFLSHGSCCNGLSSTYQVRVGRSEHLFGPYLDAEGKSLMESTGTLLLKGNVFVAGPGHNAEIITDDEGEDWFLYHGYLRSNPEMNRLVFLDRMVWEGGWPSLQEGAPSPSSVIPYFK